MRRKYQKRSIRECTFASSMTFSTTLRTNVGVLNFSNGSPVFTRPFVLHRKVSGTVLCTFLTWKCPELMMISSRLCIINQRLPVAILRGTPSAQPAIRSTSCVHWRTGYFDIVRERERERLCERECASVRERVCESVRKRESVRERECVRQCERERERECAWACSSVCAWIHMRRCSLSLIFSDLQLSDKSFFSPWSRTFSRLQQKPFSVCFILYWVDNRIKHERKIAKTAGFKILAKKPTLFKIKVKVNRCERDHWKILQKEVC